MKIALFGASGFLGTKLKKNFVEKGYNVLGVDFQGNSEFKIDATNINEVTSFMEKEKPDFVINTIGLTSSLECEKDHKKAKLLNYETAKNISESSKKIDIPLIFFSSSYVFDGKKGNYSEEDKTSPLNEYGVTKVLAEKEILSLKKGIILRVDIMYGFNGTKKPNGIFQRVLLNEEIGISEPEQIRHPLFVDDLPRIIINLVNQKKYGTLHIAGPDKINMKKFILSLGKIIKNKKIIKKEKFGKSIKIPHNSTFNLSKLKSLGIKTSSLEEAKKIIKKQINSEQL